MRSKLLRAAAAAAALAACAAAPAQAYPAKVVRLVVPQAPGGASDALARITAQKLAEKWGQQVIVENRAGAGGNIGTDAVAKSADDGYTPLLAYVGTHVINPNLYKSLTWDPIRDFAPIATLATVPFVLAVNAKLPARTVGELVALAKSQPGTVTYASASNGSVNHLLGELVLSRIRATGHATA